jgi:hypothetical protein
MGNPPNPPPGPPPKPTVEELSVAELGSASSRSASTTVSPTSRPSVTSVHTSPITPTCTTVVVGSPSSSTVTVLVAPLTVTADVGTAIASPASPVRIETEAMAPLRRPSVASVSPMVTG